LFLRRYPQAFPRGFSLSASFDGSKQHSVAYSIASGALSLTQNIKSAKSPEPAVIPNVVGKGSQFRKLRAFYDACVAEYVYFSDDFSDGPIVIRPARKRPPGEPLPLIHIDMEKVEALQKETEILTKELAAVFESNFESHSEPKKVLDSPPRQLAVSECGEETEETEKSPEAKFASLPFSLPFEEKALRSLPRRCWSCVEALLARGEWSKEEFADLARQHQSMPNALLEDVNTWSIETLGDFLLLEDEGGWIVNRDLVKDGG
jgi:hypothetical protein